jgi:hypothetical protein
VHGQSDDACVLVQLSWHTAPDCPRLTC